MTTTGQPAASADAVSIKSLLRTFREEIPIDLRLDEGNLEEYGLDDNDGVTFEVFTDGSEPVLSFVVGKDLPGGSSLTDTTLAVPRSRSDDDMASGIPSTYVPARNTILLSLALGILIAVVAALWAAYHHPDPLQNQLALPVFKDTLINLGLFYVPFGVIVIVGSANAVNLTDGLDGLAIMPTVLVGGVGAPGVQGMGIDLDGTIYAWEMGTASND